VTAPSPSGEQFEIVYREQRAIVVEVGGGVREYTADGRPVLDPYPVGAMCDGAHGAPLIPWPNRLGGGRYSFDGYEYQVALTEPDRQNAIHGLLRWHPWRALEHEPERVVMGARLHPLPGYPFTLDVRVEYALGADGLSVTTAATNVGERPCPYGAGQHPYVSAGDALIDECTLQFAARARIVTDAERKLPSGRESVAGTKYDFAAARALGDQQIDYAFTDLEREPSGRATLRLSAPDGATAELWVDESYPFLEIYTGDTLSPERRRRGLGVEPMTCAPNAFQSGEGLIRLGPSESVEGRWGARLLV
jgi:aldose 1-epimerase